MTDADIWALLTEMIAPRVLSAIIGSLYF